MATAIPSATLMSPPIKPTSPHIVGPSTLQQPVHDNDRPGIQ